MQESEHTARPWVRSAALVFNSVVLVASAIGLARTTFMPGLCAKVRIAELDRVGVINREKLEKEFPSLAVNPRRDISLWVMEDELAQVKTASLVGLAAAVGNILLVLLLCRKARTKLGESGGTGTTMTKENSGK